MGAQPRQRAKGSLRGPALVLLTDGSGSWWPLCHHLAPDVHPKPREGALLRQAPPEKPQHRQLHGL